MPITWWSQLIWLSTIGIGSFLLSWVFADLLHIARTAYVAIFAVVSGAFLFGYLQWTNIDWGTFINHDWLWGLILAVATGLLLTASHAWFLRWQSLALLPPPGPRGMRLVNLLLVDGIANGAAEALLLSVLPVLIVWQAFSTIAWFQQWPGTAFASVIAFVASLFVIGLHHLGFRELRGYLIIFVILANAAFTLVYLLTMNPLAAVIAHIMMHIGAVFQRVEVPIHQEKRASADLRLRATIP